MKRRILIALAAVVVLIAAAVIGGLLFLNSSAGRAWLADTIEQAASDPGVMELELGEIGPGLPGRITVASVALADAEGVWLEAHDVAVDWDPWALLSRRLDIRVVEAGSIAVLRQPVVPPAGDDAEAEPSAPFALPELPVDIAVGELSVPRLELGEALAGYPAELRVGAQMDATRDGRVRLDLAVDRIDGVGGSLAVNADIDLAEGRFGLFADAHEPADGVVVHLLDLAPYPEFNLSLEGEGPASAWSGTLLASAGDLVAIDLSTNVSAGETLGLVVDGSADVAALLPPDLSEIVGPQLGLKAELDVDGETIRVTSLKADLRALAVTAQGVVETGAETLDMTVDLESRDSAPLEALAAPLTFASLRLHVTAAGDMAAPDVTLEGEVGGASMPDVFSGDLTLAAAVTGDAESGWHVEGKAGASGAGTSIDAAQTLLGSDPQLAFELTTDAGFTQLSDMSVSLTGAHVDVASRGDIDLDAFSGKVTLDGSLGDVAGLSDLVGLPLAGGMAFDANLTLDPGMARATGKLNVEGREFVIGEETVQAFIGNTLTVTSEIDTDLATQLTLIDLAVVTEAADRAGAGVIDQEFSQVTARLDGPMTVTPSVAGVLGLDPVGSAGLTLRAAGALEDPVIRARAHLNGMALAGVALDGTTVVAEVREVADAPRGEGLVTLPSEVGAIKVATAFEIEDDVVVLPRLAVRGAGVDASGNMILDGDGIASGILQGSAADIAALAGMAGIDAGGAAVFRIDLAPDGAGGQGANASLQLSDVAMPLDETDSLAVKQIRLNARITDAAGAPSGTADMSVGGAVLQDYRLDGAVVKAVIDGDQVAFDVDAQGQAGVALTVTISGALDLAADDLVVAFSRLDGTVGGQAFSQEGEMRVVLGDETKAVEDLRLVMAGGTVEADVVQGPGTLDAEVVISQMSLDVVEIFLPGSAVTGLIDGRVDLATSQGVIVGTIDLSATDIDLSEEVGDEGVPADVQLTATLSETGAEAKLVVGGLPGSELDGHARVGTAIDAATLMPRNPQTASLDAALSLKAKLQDIWDDLPASDQRMRGDLDVELSATGRVGDPQISGQASLTGGSYEHLIYGTQLDDITLQITSDRSRNLTVDLSANDGGTGTVNATGKLALGENAAVDASLSFQSATLLRRDDVSATATGDITYTGSFLEGAIAGKVTTDVIQISLVNSLPTSVVVLDVDDVFDVNGNGATSRHGSVWAATLDLEIDMPRRVFVRGRGVETEWFGNVRITGTTDKPVINGRIEIQRGYVSLVGRIFDITRGVVELDPAEPDNPTLDIVAQSKHQDVTGIITISGRAADPDIAMSSEPPLPEAEVLPRVLFGKSASQMSAFEAFELASAVAELSGVGGGGPGILDRARQTLGVDVLRVGTDDEGQTVVGAGSYVTERVYVGVEQGAGSQSGAVTVEVEVTDDITIDTSTGADSSANVGVNWRWDY